MMKSKVPQLSKEPRTLEGGLRLAKATQWNRFDLFSCAKWDEDQSCPKCQRGLEILKEEQRVRETPEGIQVWVLNKNPRLEPGMDLWGLECPSERDERLEKVRKQRPPEATPEPEWRLWKEVCCEDFHKGTCDNCRRILSILKAEKCIRRSALTRQIEVRLRGGSVLFYPVHTWRRNCRDYQQKRADHIREKQERNVREYQELVERLPEHGKNFPVPLSG